MSESLKNSQEDNLKIPEFPFEDRLENEKLWVSSFEELTEKLGESTRALVGGSLRIKDEKLVPAEPAASLDGNYAIRRHGNENSVGLTVLHESDASLHPYFADFIDNHTGRYSKELNSIIVPSGDVSAQWRGLLLFHELEHVHCHDRNMFRDETNGYWLEEAHVYDIETKIISDIYGKEYADLVEKHVQSLNEKISKDNLKVQDLIGAAKDVISKTFDQPKSDLEYRLRQGAVMINIAFEINKVLGKDSISDQARFLQKLYNSKDDSEKIFN